MVTLGITKTLLRAYLDLKHCSTYNFQLFLSKDLSHYIGSCNNYVFIRLKVLNGNKIEVIEFEGTKYRDVQLKVSNVDWGSFRAFLAEKLNLYYVNKLNEVIS